MSKRSDCLLLALAVFFPLACGNEENHQDRKEETKPSNVLTVMVAGTTSPSGSQERLATEYRVDDRILPVGNDKALREAIQSIVKERDHAGVKIEHVHIQAVRHADYEQVATVMSETLSTETGFGWRFILDSHTVDAKAALAVKELEDWGRVRQMKFDLKADGDANEDVTIEMDGPFSGLPGEKISSPRRTDELFIRATDNTAKRNQILRQIGERISQEMKTAKENRLIWAAVLDPDMKTRWRYVFAVMQQARDAGVAQMTFALKAGG